jgi:putative oxidoreductase
VTRWAGAPSPAAPARRPGSIVDGHGTGGNTAHRTAALYSPTRIRRGSGATPRVGGVGGVQVDVIVLIGRVLFVAIFLGSGFAHLTQTSDMADFTSSKGIPNARLLVQLSGVQMLVGGLMVLLGVWMDLGFLILAAFLLPAALLFHAFWKVEDPAQLNVERAQFMKNLSLTGACLALFALVAFVGPDLGLTITEPLFDLD